MFILRIMSILALVLPLTFVSTVHAAISTIQNASIEQIYAVDNNPGGYCYARLDKTVAYDGSSTVNCDSNAVLFDCGKANEAVRTFDLAILALLHNHPIDVRVSDATKTGDSCLATHIYLTGPGTFCQAGDSSSGETGTCEEPVPVEEADAISDGAD